MTDTVTTRIKLPGEVHREVKAEAARHGINVDQALGMCVAFLCDLTTPLRWLESSADCLFEICGDIESGKILP